MAGRSPRSTPARPRSSWPMRSTPSAPATWPRPPPPSGAHLLYVSTDYVFDGTSGRPYREWDAPNPMSVYGASKLAGERECPPGSTIVRTSWVCGAHGANMVKTALRLAAGRGRRCSFVDDQHGSPTFTADLAPAIVTLGTDRRPGIFHVTNSGTTTWWGFVRAVLEAAGDDPERVQRHHHRRPRPDPLPGAPPGQLGARQHGPAPERPAALAGLARWAGAARQRAGGGGSGGEARAAEEMQA